MNQSSQRRRKIKKVLIIALCWVIFIAITYINQYFFVLDLIELEKVQGHYDFWPDFFGFVILSAFGGLVCGYILVFRMESRYKKRSFIFGIINSTFFFIVIFLATAIIGLFGIAFIYFLFQTDFNSALITSWNNLLVNIYTPSFIISMFSWGFLVAGTQFMLQVSDKFGSGVLWKFITGKYYHPREEERIFMFLDLKSSTTIAEKIGNKQFFGLLKDVFHDITKPIVNHMGEIYQYVGDEVVISWPMENGITHNNCIACYFSVEKTLQERKEYYLENYTFSPSFKAGLHFGIATVGEIGVIKKDIVYSGDVLNTTSRIQDECNKYQANFLASKLLLEKLVPDEKFAFQSIGKIQLRGKEDELELNSVSLN